MHDEHLPLILTWMGSTFGPLMAKYIFPRKICTSPNAMYTRSPHFSFWECATPPESNKICRKTGSVLRQIITKLQTQMGRDTEPSTISIQGPPASHRSYGQDSQTSNSVVKRTRAAHSCRAKARTSDSTAIGPERRCTSAVRAMLGNAHWVAHHGVKMSPTAVGQ